MRWAYGGSVAAGLLLVGAGWLTAHVMTPTYDEGNIGAGLLVAVGYLLILVAVLGMVLTGLSRAVRERRFIRRAR